MLKEFRDGIGKILEAARAFVEEVVLGALKELSIADKTKERGVI